jgi:hypothetical protein
MATTTPNYGWPVPTSTDFVKDGAQAIEDLGDAIDATVFALPTSALTLITTATFSASSTIQIDDCFSATYTGYRLVFDFTTVGSAVRPALQYSVGGTPATTGYILTGFQAYSGGSSIISNVVSAHDIGVTTSTSGSNFNSIVLDILNPFDTRATRIQGQTGMLDNSSPNRWFYGNFSGYNSNATSYDGIKITAGTVTGTIKIYGYQD